MTMPKRPKPSTYVKAAADRAARRSAGEPVDTDTPASPILAPAVPVDAGPIPIEATPEKVARKDAIPFSQELADRICDHIAAGESLRSFCELDDAPCKKSVMRWLRQNPEFSAQYARAREEQAESQVDKIIEIADDPTIKADDKRVRIDARKWHAEKMKPKKYGPVTKTELTGIDGGPIQLNDMSMNEAARRLAFMLRSAIEDGRSGPPVIDQE